MELVLGTGLPDGIFSHQKSDFGQIWECHALKDVGKFYGHLANFTSYISCPFGMFCGQFGIFSRFGMLCQEKSGNPGWE
jgi:hypothetical protein